MGAIKELHHDFIVAQQDGLVLDLVVSYKWFDMWASGEKTEDYRAIKEYWERKILKYYKGDYSNPEFKNFEFLVIRKGYTKNRLIFRGPSLFIGKPVPGWAPDEWLNVNHFIIRAAYFYDANVSTGYLTEIQELQLKPGDKLVRQHNHRMERLEIGYVYTFSNWLDGKVGSSYFQCQEYFDTGVYPAHSLDIGEMTLYDPEIHKDYPMMTPERLLEKRAEFIEKYGE